MAKLDMKEKKWVVDKTQPANAYTALAHNWMGNPAFITDEPYTAFIKLNGDWKKMDTCIGRLAFGGDGSMYKRGCLSSNYGHVYKFNNAT